MIHLLKKEEQTKGSVHTAGDTERPNPSDEALGEVTAEDKVLLH